jgi:hypothetical protein
MDRKHDNSVKHHIINFKKKKAAIRRAERGFCKAVCQENAKGNVKKGEDGNEIYGCCDDDVTRTYA